MQRVRHRFLAVRCSDASVPVHRQDLCKEEARVVIVIDYQDSEGGHVARSYIGRRTWARKTYRGVQRGTRKHAYPFVPDARKPEQRGRCRRCERTSKSTSAARGTTRWSRRSGLSGLASHGRMAAPRTTTVDAGGALAYSASHGVHGGALKGWTKA